MSLTPFFIQEDEFYQFDLYRSCEDSLNFLQGNRSAPDWIIYFNSLLRIFEDMEKEKPFSINCDSVNQRPMLTERVESSHRHPVWDAIFEIVCKLKQDAPPKDQKTCATFLKEQLILLKRNIDFSIWLDKCKEEVKEMGMSVSVHTSHSALSAVNIVYSQRETGEYARDFMISFLKEAIEKLKETKE